MVPYTARMLKSAISAPPFLLDHQMVHYIGRVLKSAISAPTWYIDTHGGLNGPLPFAGSL